MKYIISLFLFLVSLPICAKEIFPKGCKAIVVDGETLNLKLPKLPALIMLHNLSNSNLWLTHQDLDAAAHAGWTTQLHAGHWSALNLNTSNFELSCVESKPGHEQQLPCTELIAVCHWPHAKMPENSKGSYWAGENMELSELIAYIARRGFILK